jgi:hypothetical protein
MNREPANKAHAFDGAIPSLFQVGSDYRAAIDAHRWL